MDRDINGRFRPNGGKTLYKRVQYAGNNMLEQQRNFCVVLDIEKIPRGFVVHHLNGDKMDNDINNLALMTITAHNRIHTHIPWNKGLNTRESEKWNKTIQKAIASRKGNYVAIKGKEVYEMRLGGMTIKDIASKLGTSRETASNRLNAYLEHQKILDPSKAKRIDKFNKIKELRYSKHLSWQEVGEEIGEDPILTRRFYKRFMNISSKNV